jgi:hypothetical protein
MPARFQCYADGRGWHWRLLGANNRSLARSPEAFADRATALREAAETPGRAARGRLAIVGNGRGWHWVLLEGETVRAVSTTRYQRRLDCVRATRRFRSTAATAHGPHVASRPVIGPSLRLPEGGPDTAGITELGRPATPGRCTPDDGA